MAEGLPTHLPVGSEFRLYTDPSGANSLTLQIPDQEEEDLAWQAPDASDESFESVCRAVANYYSRPLEVIDQSDG